jgi:hypothetical protein
VRGALGSLFDPNAPRTIAATAPRLPTQPQLTFARADPNATRIYS